MHFFVTDFFLCIEATFTVLNQQLPSNPPVLMLNKFSIMNFFDRSYFVIGSFVPGFVKVDFVRGFVVRREGTGFEIIVDQPPVLILVQLMLPSPCSHDNLTVVSSKLQDYFKGTELCVLTGIPLLERTM